MLGSGGLASVEESQAFLEANPDVREALAASMRASMAERYAAFFVAAGLTDAEREQFLTIHALGSRRIVGEHQFSLGSTMISGAEFTRQLRELLGEARYQQYRAFQDNTAPRDLAREMTRSLYFTSTPLDAAQATELQRIVAQAVRDPSLGPKYTGVWAYIPNPVWERIASEAGAVLASPQMDALRELQQQSAFSHAQGAASKAWREKQAAAEKKGN
jgi:hypothetical protein